MHGHVHPGPDGVTKSANTYTQDPADRGNLAHRTPAGLTDGITTILTACHHLLRPGGTVVITARPWRRHGTLVDLPAAVVTAGTQAGLIPTERCVALLAAIRDGHLIARPSFFQLHAARKTRAAGTPAHLIAHEDVIVLTKPPSSASSGKSKGSQREPDCQPGSDPTTSAGAGPPPADRAVPGAAPAGDGGSPPGPGRRRGPR